MIPTRTTVLSMVGLLLCATAPTAFAAKKDWGEIVLRSIDVWQKFAAQNDGPPQGLVDSSACIAIVPRVVKGALGVGGKHGSGVLACRRPDGEWSAPVPMKISGGSIGLQAGASASDVIFFIVDERSARALLHSKFTVGADAKVAAGPRSAGAEATTDWRLKADIYSYSTSRGLFAGAALDGAKMSVVRKAISRYYHAYVLPEDILFGDVEFALTEEAERLQSVLP